MPTQSEVRGWQARSWISRKTEAAAGGAVTRRAEGHCWAPPCLHFLSCQFQHPPAEPHALSPSCLFGRGCSQTSQGTCSESWERSAQNSQESHPPPPATFSAPGCRHFPFTGGNPELSSALTPTQGDPLAKSTACPYRGLARGHTRAQRAVVTTLQCWPCFS